MFRRPEKKCPNQKRKSPTLVKKEEEKNEKTAVS